MVGDTILFLCQLEAKMPCRQHARSQQRFPPLTRRKLSLNLPVVSLDNVGSLLCPHLMIQDYRRVLDLWFCPLDRGHCGGDVLVSVMRNSYTRLQTLSLNLSADRKSHAIGRYQIPEIQEDPWFEVTVTFSIVIMTWICSSHVERMTEAVMIIDTLQSGRDLKILVDHDYESESDLDPETGKNLCRLFCFKVDRCISGIKKHTRTWTLSPTR